MPRLINADKFITDNKPMLSSLLMRRINDAPTVDAEPVRHGRWTSCQGLAEVGECQCSACKSVYYADDLYNVGETDENGCGQALLPNYCPHCGAQMDEV